MLHMEFKLVLWLPLITPNKLCWYLHMRLSLTMTSYETNLYLLWIKRIILQAPWRNNMLHKFRYHLSAGNIHEGTVLMLWTCYNKFRVKKLLYLNSILYRPEFLRWLVCLRHLSLIIHRWNSFLCLLSSCSIDFNMFQYL